MVGLEKITNRIISDANTRAEEIIAEAQARCDEIARSAADKCDGIRVNIETDAVAECENIKSRSISAMDMYRRDRLMNVRVEMIDRAFSKARDEILSMGQDKYKDFMASLLCRILEEQVDSERESFNLYGEDISPESYDVIMNRTDRESFGVHVIAGVRRGTIGKITGEVLEKVHLSEEVADISGGIILKCGDIEINSSLDRMLYELRAKIESEVDAELFRYVELPDDEPEVTAEAVFSAVDAGAGDTDEPREAANVGENAGIEISDEETSQEDEDSTALDESDEFVALDELVNSENEGLWDVDVLYGADEPEDEAFDEQEEQDSADADTENEDTADADNGGEADDIPELLEDDDSDDDTLVGLDDI